jgi:polyribonucleotide nucleotidyltransferase
MDSVFGDELQKALDIKDKHTRGAAVAKVEKKISKEFSAPLVTSSGPSLKIDEDDSVAVIQADADATPLPGDITEDVLVATEPEKGFDAEAAEAEASELMSGGRQSSLASINVASNAGNDPIDVKIAIKKLLVRRLRGMILSTGKRSDGRTVEGVRPIEIETSFLPGAHGSALFTRGETQSLATATLGSKAMEAK